MIWKEAIILILQNNKENGEFRPMHYRDITDSIIENNLREEGKYGKTPADTVNANLSTNPKLFEAIGGGNYKLTKEGESFSIKNTKKLSTKEVPIETQHSDQLASITIQDNLIKNFGMYWIRDGVNWKHNPKLLGSQSDGAQPIDLSEMRGVYMLYDGREVIYVGQAADQPILKRLIQHTKNRLATRWNRFSWFGIDKVNKEGKVEKISNPIVTDVSKIITALEGILIEGLEPRQNRKGGDNFGFEYYQEIDKNLAKTRIYNELEKLM